MRDATNRREFMTQAGTGSLAAGTLAWSGAIRVQAADQAEERMPVALIGPGGMGGNHLDLLVRNPRVKVATICDPDSDRLAKAAKTVEDVAKNTPNAVADMRRVFDDKSIQAVWIATPDHWHAPAAILACQAGKHVYVEKPCSHNLREGRLMVEAARANHRVMQVGTQSRSTAHVQQAIKRLREGVIGEVLVAKAWNSQRRGSIGHAQPSDPPTHLDFDLWLGPAPKVPYQKNLLPGIWRWWYAFGTGDMGNDGVHDIDIARWGLGVDQHPTRITALGGKYFFNDDQQFPDTQYVVFEYDSPGNHVSNSAKPKQLIFEQRIWSPYVQEGYENGDAFYGTNGMMLLAKSGGYQIHGPRNKLIEKVENRSPDLQAHHDNFLECIRTAAKPNADIEINHLSTSLCHLGNIATRVGRLLRFDPKNEKMLDEADSEATALLHREYREGGHWAVPRNA